MSFIEYGNIGSSLVQHFYNVLNRFYIPILIFKYINTENPFNTQTLFSNFEFRIYNLNVIPNVIVDNTFIWGDILAFSTDAIFGGKKNNKCVVETQ